MNKMKPSLKILLLLLLPLLANAQQSRVDSAIAVLTKSNTPNILIPSCL